MSASGDLRGTFLQWHRHGKEWIGILPHLRNGNKKGSSCGWVYPEGVDWRCYIGSERMPIRYSYELDAVRTVDAAFRGGESYIQKHPERFLLAVKYFLCQDGITCPPPEAVYFGDERMIPIVFALDVPLFRLFCSQEGGVYLQHDGKNKLVAVYSPRSPQVIARGIKNRQKPKR